MATNCTVVDCESLAVMRNPSDLCPKHYARWWRNGHFELTGHGARWAGDAVTYSGAHIRVRNVKGRACEHDCVDCGDQAAHWSYDHADPDEKTDERGRAFSPNPGHYEPKCVPCHKRADLERIAS